MTDATTETRDLIARVRDGIAPADQPQALYDLARTADGEPRVDAEMLRREADGIEGVSPSYREHLRVTGETAPTVVSDEEEALRARVAELEEKLAEAEQDAANVREVSAVVRAEDYEEIEQLRARVAELEAVPGKATAAHALAMAEARGRREGAEAMRERAAALVDLVREREWTPEECAAAVRALPLPLDDAQGEEVNER